MSTAVTIVVIILIVIILASIGGLIYYFWKKGSIAPIPPVHPGKEEYFLVQVSNSGIPYNQVQAATIKSDLGLMAVQASSVQMVADITANYKPGEISYQWCSLGGWTSDQHSVWPVAFSAGYCGNVPVNDQSGSSILIQPQGYLFLGIKPAANDPRSKYTIVPYYTPIKGVGPQQILWSINDPVPAPTPPTSPLPLVGLPEFFLVAERDSTGKPVVYPTFDINVANYIASQFKTALADRIKMKYITEKTNPGDMIVDGEQFRDDLGAELAAWVKDGMKLGFLQQTMTTGTVPTVPYYKSSLPVSNGYLLYGLKPAKTSPLAKKFMIYNYYSPAVTKVPTGTSQCLIGGSCRFDDDCTIDGTLQGGCTCVLSIGTGPATGVCQGSAAKQLPAVDETAIGQTAVWSKNDLCFQTNRYFKNAFPGASGSVLPSPAIPNQTTASASTLCNKLRLDSTSTGCNGFYLSDTGNAFLFGNQPYTPTNYGCAKLATDTGAFYTSCSYPWLANMPAKCGPTVKCKTDKDCGSFCGCNTNGVCTVPFGATIGSC